MRVPYYSVSMYQSVIKAPYNGNGGWIDLKDVLAIMTPDFVSSLATLSAMQVGNYTAVGTINMAGKSFPKADIVRYAKLLMPTLWTCDYFYRNVGKGTHMGVDIIMPRGTPIESLWEGEVVKTKRWDGVKKDDGNCVVVKCPTSLGTFYFAYEHLDTITCQLGQKVSRGEVIGTCGSTGNSTQFHVHLQIDKEAQFHPFWSGDIQTIKTYTVDPIETLRKLYGVSSSSPISQPPVTPTPPTKPTTPTTPINPTPPSGNSGGDLMGQLFFSDLPNDSTYKKAINEVHTKGIMVGSGTFFRPNDFVTRGEFAIVLHRIYEYRKLAIPVKNSDTFQDVVDPEQRKAVSFLAQRDIINGYSNGNFGPDNPVKAVECIAMICRMLRGLKDGIQTWFETYVQKYKQIGAIGSSYDVFQNVTRAETARLVSYVV